MRRLIPKELLQNTARTLRGMLIFSLPAVKVGKCKDLTSKKNIVTHLRSGMSTPQNSKMLKREYRTVKKAVDKILYERKPN